MPTVEIDASTPFGAALARMWETHSRKASDYTEDPSVDPWENFRLVGDQLGISKEDAVEALIAVKQARLKSLRGKAAKNEPTQDTVLDRAVYSTIRLAMDLEAAKGTESSPTPHDGVVMTRVGARPYRGPWRPQKDDWVTHKTEGCGYGVALSVDHALCHVQWDSWGTVEAIAYLEPVGMSRHPRVTDAGKAGR